MDNKPQEEVEEFQETYGKNMFLKCFMKRCVSINIILNVEFLKMSYF
jgi:hypothetical protein